MTQLTEVPVEASSISPVCNVVSEEFIISRI